MKKMNRYKITLRHDLGDAPFEKTEKMKAESAQKAVYAMQDKYPEMYVTEVYREVESWTNLR